MTGLLFVQMSGAPGAGKTTLARALAPRVDAVVVDHDVTKSALLDAGIPAELAGPGSYRVLRAVARHLLEQGRSVIFDSPCLYDELLLAGQQMAAETGARYRYLECVLEDLAELDRRLRERPRRPSQLAGVHAPPAPGSGKSRVDAQVFRDWIANMKRPDHGHLVLDTARPLDACVAEALVYLRA